MNNFHSYQWPKTVKPLTESQKAISDDFIKYCQDVFHKDWSGLSKFNSTYLTQNMRITDGIRTLEVGAGNGDHLAYENLENQEYWANDRRDSQTSLIRSRFPNVKTINSDCQEGFDVPDGYFDRIIANNVLEHLPNLPKAVEHLERLLSDKGQLGVALPCDPGLAYRVGKYLTTERAFKKRYKQSYSWFVESEHINAPEEVLHVLRKHFKIVHRTYYPCFVPIKHINLLFGMVLEKKTEAD
jgi:SAM-dependent methyltransferase